MLDRLKSPARTIRAYCVECTGISQVKNCDNAKCILHSYRHGHKADFEGAGDYRPTKAIRKYCLNCVLDDSKEVRLCPATNCLLHPYRMGHKPKPQNGNLA